MDKVSIVIPVYNAEKYLNQCLDSLINQTYKNLEIICVNDGSKDSSLNILNEYAKKDARIKIVTQNNQGGAIARNTGLKYITGEYLLIVDADDYFAIDMVEKFYNKAIATDADIVLCNNYLFDNQTKSIKPQHSIKNDYPLPKTETFNYKNYKDYIFNFTYGCTWNKFYKTNLILSNNLQFQNVKIVEDVYFVFSSLVLAEKITLMEDEYLIYYRVNTGTQNTTKHNKFPLDFLKVLNLLSEYLEKTELLDDLKQSFINYAINLFIFVYNNVDSKNKKLISNNFKKEIVDKFNLNKKDKTYFYRNNYNIICELQGIMSKFIRNFEKIYFLHRILS